MDDTEKIVTIVGSVLAHEGAEFVYAGKIPECDNCKVGKVCHNAKLREGRRYRVIAVRPGGSRSTNHCGNSNKPGNPPNTDYLHACV